jgi:hypothetical protein
MNYVEWLRVRNCLRVVAIALGVLVLGGIVTRIAVNKYLQYDTWITHFQHDAGATTSQTTLPDGTVRITIDDPRQQTRVVIDDHGIAGKHITITEPIGRYIIDNGSSVRSGSGGPNVNVNGHSDITLGPGDHISVGSLRMSDRRQGKFKVVTIDTNAATPIGYYLALADFAALIVATALAAPLAREADGHLEISLTKPASRTRFALGAIGVDIAGIVCASAMTIVALLVIQALFEVPHIDLGGIGGDALVMAVALPAAWYAMLCSATTSMRRGYGAVLGFAWPIAILVVVFANIQPGDSLVLAAIRDAFWVVSRIDPLAYPASLGATATAVAHGTAVPGATLRLAAELALFVVYGALAIVQWRRLEA